MQKKKKMDVSVKEQVMKLPFLLSPAMNLSTHRQFEECFENVTGPNGGGKGDDESPLQCNL